MKLLSAIGGGLAGAVTLTLLNQVLKKTVSDAPRMDLLGMEALSKSLRKVNMQVPPQKKLYEATLIGDILSNAIYYGFVADKDKKTLWKKGILLGLAAGLGAIELPKTLRLHEEYSARTNKTRLLTTAMYLAGGIAAATITKLLEKDNKKRA